MGQRWPSRVASYRDQNRVPITLTLLEWLVSRYRINISGKTRGLMNKLKQRGWEGIL